MHSDGARHFGIVVGELHGEVHVELGELGNASVAVELLDLCSSQPAHSLSFPLRTKRTAAFATGFAVPAPLLRQPALVPIKLLWRSVGFTATSSDLSAE